MIEALMLAATVASGAVACPLERAGYVLHGQPEVIAWFQPRTPTPDWPMDVQLSVRTAEQGVVHVFLPFSGNGRGISTHLASVKDPAHPPSPDDGKSRPLRDTDYLVADATYRFDEGFWAKRGAAAPAHLFIPGLQSALWYQTPSDARESVVMGFFDLKTCGPL